MEQASIPVFVPHLGVDTLKAVTDAFDVGWIGMGATTLDFEQRLGRVLDTDRPVTATMTGTAALHLALRLAGMRPGDEVIVPSFNFVADVQAILWTGATPVFADIEIDTLGLDPTRVAEAITDRTRAIMPLHFAGAACAIDAIHAIARDRDLRVIEDATHAFGTSVAGRPVGSFGDLVCFSFDPVKIITCLDGGAVVCRTDDDLERLRRLRLLGIDRDTTERYLNRRAWDYDVTDIGYRDHMTNINAAIGCSQLDRFEEILANRRRDCMAYDEAFADLDWLITPHAEWATVGPFIYTLRVLDDRREAFMEHLKSRDVATGIHFQPCHDKTICRTFPRGDLPVTELVGREIVTLPLWSFMDRATRDRVIDAVVSFVPAPVEAASCR